MASYAPDSGMNELDLHNTEKLIKPQTIQIDRKNVATV